MNLDIKAILANLPLFRELSSQELDRIAGHAREVRVSKGAFVFQKSDPSSGFYVVVHGQVKLAFPSPQGGEKVVEIISARQSFGEAVMFLEKPYPVFAQALVDTLMLHIERAMVFEELARDPAFARKMLAGLSIRLHGLIKDVESYSLRSCTQRVIGYLLQQGPETATGDVILSLPTSKNVIASRLNITPETFSRILHDLSEASLISVKGKDICIPDLEKLRVHDQQEHP